MKAESSILKCGRCDSRLIRVSPWVVNSTIKLIINCDNCITETHYIPKNIYGSAGDLKARGVNVNQKEGTQ